MKPDPTLIAILILGLALRLWGVASQSLSVDEFDDLDAAISGDSWWDTIHAPKRFPPLYHLLLRGWSDLVGTGTASRVLSVILGLALIAVMWKFGGLLGGRRLSIFAAGLTAISPFAIWYSQEVRAYGLYLLIAALFLWQLTMALESGSGTSWAWATIAAIAGIYTHYYFGLLVVLGGIFTLIVYRLRPPIASVRGALVVGVAAVPAAFLWITDIEAEWGFASESGFGLAELGFSYYSMVSGYSLGPSLRALHTLDAVAAVQQAFPWLVLGFVPAAVLAVIGFRRLGHKRPAQLLLAAAATIPVVGVGALSLVAPFGFTVKHTVFMFVPLALFVANGALDRRPLARVAVIALVMTSLLAIGFRQLDSHHQNEDTRAVAEYIAGTETPVFVISGYLDEVLVHYTQGPVTPLPDIGADGEGLEAALDLLDATSDYWLAVSRTFHGDPEGLLLQSLAAEVELEVSFAGIDLYRSSN